jgi:GR25 family glycosyltransferase involved in LPS biosynthesis
MAALYMLLGCWQGTAVEQGYIIALDARQAEATAKQAMHFLGIRNVSVFPAINGTRALAEGGDSLSLYTRYLLYYQSRHDHMQLSTPPMLGCLLSHMRIWGGLQPNQTVAVFEEDALFDATSTERYAGLLEDVRAHPWDILMLESGSVIASGP